MTESIAADRERFALIRDAAMIADTPLSTEEVVERFVAVLTSSFAQTCEIELGATHPPRHTAHELVVTLGSRGRDLGTMRLTHAARTYSVADFEFAGLIGGRAGLALENAQLARRETILMTALDSLAEAVTIQDAEAGLIYANDAAAAALGFESAAELLATKPQEIVDAYTSFLEDGRPLTLDQLPGRRLLRGETPVPLIVRAIHRVTREERWRIVKATAVPGYPKLAVNVIEDVTDVKRAESAQRFLAQAGARCWPRASTTSRRSRGSPASPCRALADWCAVSLPDGHGLAGRSPSPTPIRPRCDVRAPLPGALADAA